MTTKHTPGPWRVNPGANEVRGADWNVIVADVGIDADAHLIAAAPDLLTALEAMVRSDSWADADVKMVNARAAIAKAKGKKP